MRVKCGEAESQLLCIEMSIERCPFVPADSQDQCSTGSSAGLLKSASQMLIFSLPEHINSEMHWLLTELTSESYILQKQLGIYNCDACS